MSCKISRNLSFSNLQVTDKSHVADNSMHRIHIIVHSGHKEQDTVRKYNSKTLMQNHSVTVASLLFPTGSSVMRSPNFLRPAYP